MKGLSYIMYGCMLFSSLSLMSCSQEKLVSNDVQKLVEDASLEWDGNINSSFYDGAFLGDGLQGVMVMRDDKDSLSLRMLMGHYKAIAHYTIQKWEYCNSRVYAGSIMITPSGKEKNQTMKMDIWDGEVDGEIITDKGEVKWNLCSDRDNKVFVVSVKTMGAEEPKLYVRPEWGITPRIYLENKNPEDYVQHLPPKPQTIEKDGMKLIINKMKNRGAHTVASKIVQSGDEKLMYVAIGTSDNVDLDKAAQESMDDAISRINKSLSVKYAEMKEINNKWWNDYYQESSIEIKEDVKWQRFWWLQMYKFACASYSDSDLIMDTQGPWICPTAWAGVWWNLNVQLSYMPIYSSNKLEVGKSFVNGMDRLYKSGAFHKNAQGAGGITVGRSSTYEGFAGWGDEFGNMPWLLHCYWKYWKYSGDDTYAKKLFPMLKDNAQFLFAKMKKNAEGKYEMVYSRSPEYTEELLWNTNYALMSAYWVYKTLLEMNEQFAMNDPMATQWKEVLSNLSFYPTDENGLRISSDQGFEMGHRHYSHLLAIYPYHTLSPDVPQERELIERSVNHWLTLTKKSGHSGYTYTGGCSMLATLGKGNEALETLDLLYDSKLTSNTMYKEGGGQVIETPLSAVESINYMLLQSWNDKIHIFPAVPDKWKNVRFEKFRTQGAFLVNASLKEGKPCDISILSEKDSVCKVKIANGLEINSIKDNSGNKIEFKEEDRYYVFNTIKNVEYKLELNE